MYTVKQLSDLAGISPRTLHYYDEIGLLRPATHGDNGYRYYGEDCLPRLQQILFFKELDFSLDEIRTVMAQPGFDVAHALQVHRQALLERVERLNRLIQTIDKTTLHLKGQKTMKKKEYFEGFSEEKQKEYEKEIRQKYGDKAFDGVTDWNSYTPEQALGARLVEVAQVLVPAGDDLLHLGAGVALVHDGRNVVVDGAAFINDALFLLGGVAVPVGHAFEGLLAVFLADLRFVLLLLFFAEAGKIVFFLHGLLSL